jgi:hypothetical protein
MPAPSPWDIACAQLAAYQGGDGLGAKNRSSGPKKGQDERRSAAERISRRLPTAADVIEAALYRLRTWTPEQVAAGLEAVAGMLPDLDPKRLAVPDRRDPWTAACALAVLHANAVGDLSLFWAAAAEVLAAHRQAQKARHEHRGDSLDVLLAAYLRELPDIEPRELWSELKRRAEEDDDVIHEFDEMTGRVGYQAGPHDVKPTSITYGTFRKRVQRLREVRRRPASVAPVADDANTAHHRRAA